MFYIVEQDSKLDSLQRLSKLGLYVDVISSNDLYHPKLTSTIAVYIRPVNSKHGYIIPINHDEGLSIPKDRIYGILSSASKLYTVNKKDLLYHFNLQEAIDLSLLYSMVKYDRLEYSRENNTLNHFYNKFRDFPNINQLIPISKLYESCEKVYDQVEHVIDFEIPNGFDFYNKTATNVFFLLEQSGIGIHYEAFKKMFTPRNPLFNTVDNTVLTSYNLYNVTSRPTNAFNSVNFAAIPKNPEHRKCFRPTGDHFVEFDFDGYHLRLLSNQIGYELTDESAHIQLAKLYFEKDDITDEEYGNWRVELNDNTLPKVLVLDRYWEELAAKKMPSKDREYLNACYNSGNWLVKSMNQRAITLLRVAREIVKQQPGFLEKGLDDLKPMTLRDIAEALDLHESTVSRVTANKLMETPRGIFDLKFFFSVGISAKEGDKSHSARAVKERIKNLVASETSNLKGGRPKIFSDEALALALQNDGIDIARRTVAKYRESIGIPSSADRKRAARLLS